MRGQKQTGDMLYHAQSLHMSPQSFSTKEFSSVLQSHTEWASSARNHAVMVASHLLQLVPEGLPDLPIYSARELRDAQLQDKILSWAWFYVERAQRPFRRERTHTSLKITEPLRKVCFE